VNRNVKVERLNADLLDGLDASAFARLGRTNTAERTTLSNPTGTPLRLLSASDSAPLQVSSTVRVRNLNADLLDGRDATEFALASELESLAVAHHELAEQHAALLERVTALEELLAGATRTQVGGYDTLQLAGVNLQLINGSGSTSTGNGLGNLVLGYSTEASPGIQARSGSHNLVVGDGHAWSSTGGIVAGYRNTTSGAGATVLGGTTNTASGNRAVVVGGSSNTANGARTVVAGGSGNTARGEHATVSGGGSNTAEGDHATVSGGRANKASGDAGAVFWTGDFTSISGGTYNTATGYASSILGGHKQTAPGDHDCRPGC
jgi:hypothetical protein